ncbi:premnaspirodiene oxygenase-like [Asparagus officinalis]|nr:premnaspirodiene oxygenase-like [Asparagus officinalis]
MRSRAGGARTACGSRCSKSHGAVHAWRSSCGQIPAAVVVTCRLPPAPAGGHVARESSFRYHDISYRRRGAENIAAANVILYGPIDMLFAPFGEYYKKVRRLFVMELMSPKRVQSYQSAREIETVDLLNIVENHRLASTPVNFSELFHIYTNNLIARVAFGKRSKHGKDFLDAFKESLQLASGFNAVDLFPSMAGFIGLVTGMTTKIDRCHKKVDGILQGVIDDRREQIAKEAEDVDGGGRRGESEVENILDVLCKIRDEGGYDLELDHTSMKAVLFDIFAGGSGTSASAMTWTMSELICNPAAMKKAQDEVRQVVGNSPKITEAHIKQFHYLKLVIKESLRLHPPAPLLVPRLTTDAFKIHNYDIPLKTLVVFNAYAMARDPEFWPEPEVFKPERFEESSVDFKGTNYEFIPFGAGRRLCPGIMFGLVGMEIALANLLCYFDWRMPEGMAKLDMSEISGLGARRKYDLCLCPVPFAPLPVDVY